MRVAIIGAKGMLGHEFVRVFRDADVCAWDTAELDITNAGMVRERIASARPECIVNAAAYNAVDLAEEESEIANRVNGLAVGYLAEAAADVGATFVHYSTDYVFDGTDRAGYAEDAAPHPINAYGRSKRMGEEALYAMAATHPDLRWYLIRTTRLFGAPASSPGAKRSFVDTMVALSRARDRIEAVDDELSSPTYVPDLAIATRELISGSAYPHHPRDSSASSVLPSGIYHRTNDGACTWYGFAREIFRQIGWRGELVPVAASAFPRPAARPRYSVLKTTRIPPLRRWEDALSEYLRIPK